MVCLPRQTLGGVNSHRNKVADTLVSTHSYETYQNVFLIVVKHEKGVNASNHHGPHMTGPADVTASYGDIP